MTFIFIFDNLSKMKKGIFITFEGGEGCGKSTQVRHLYKYLKSKGYNVVLTYEPGGGEISNKIRNILLSLRNKNLHYKTELLLYLASRAQHIEEKIKPALKDGKIVICDRFSDSTFAYQGGARKIPENIIKFIDDFATSKTKPDITILLDISPEEGLKRIENIKYDRLENEEINFHRRVRKSYLQLAQKNVERIKIFDGREEVKVLHNKIVREIDKLLLTCNLQSPIRNS